MKIFKRLVGWRAEPITYRISLPSLRTIARTSHPPVFLESHPINVNVLLKV